jgi:hypothetical protein
MSLHFKFLRSVSAWNWVPSRDEETGGPAENQKLGLPSPFFLREATSPVALISMATEKYNSTHLPRSCLPMVDAFPLPRHREKLCCSRSQCSHESPKFTHRATRRPSATRKSIDIVRAILADIQRGAEQLQISMTTNYEASRRFTFSHTRNVLIYHHEPIAKPTRT